MVSFRQPVGPRGDGVTRNESRRIDFVLTERVGHKPAPDVLPSQRGLLAVVV